MQIDIKYAPQHCTDWDSKGVKYYQITALDEYSRKRVCVIVDEKSVTHTATFVLDLREKMGFNIEKIQTDNGREFTNDPEQHERLSIFENVLKDKGITYKKHIRIHRGKMEKLREVIVKIQKDFIINVYSSLMRI